MKNKTFVLVMIVLIATLVTATPALADYSSITGTVLDSKTLSSWTYGGTIDAWDCSDIEGTNLVPPAERSFSDGTINVSVGSPATTGYLCVRITFNAGSQGTPSQKFYFTLSSGQSGAYALGNIYTDTGPNAVTLADASAQSPNQWLAVALVIVALVGAGGVVLLLRRRRIA